MGDAIKGRSLIISDVQEPFGAENAIRFCKAVQKEFNIPSDSIYNVGDESDFYFGSSHPKSPEAWLTPTGELKALQSKIQAWSRAFPEMKLAISNHMLRWVRRAFASEIPKELLRSYQDVIGAPKGWAWKLEWRVSDTKAQWRMIHGMGYSGILGHRNAVIDSGISTVIGHLHSNAGVNYVNTGQGMRWGMNVGCLIDVDAFAFEYNKFDRVKPILGCGVVIDGGLTPIFIPYERL